MLHRVNFRALCDTFVVSERRSRFPAFELTIVAHGMPVKLIRWRHPLKDSPAL